MGKTYIPPDLTQSPIVDHVLDVLRAYEQATTDTTVPGFRQKTGFGFIQRDDTYYFWVDESKIWSSATFLKCGALIILRAGSRRADGSRIGDG
jgi:hypothetical protein